MSFQTEKAYPVPSPVDKYISAPSHFTVKFKKTKIRE